MGARAADGEGPRATAPSRRALSGAEGAPAHGGGGRDRGLSRGVGRAQNEEREARANKKERETEYGGVVLGAGGARSWVDGGEQGRRRRRRDVGRRRRSGAAAVRARSTMARRREEEDRRALPFIGQGTFSPGPSHSPGLKGL